MSLTSSPYVIKSMSSGQTSMQVNKQLKIVEKQLNDLEELCQKMIELNRSLNNTTSSFLDSNATAYFIRDDCYELQKFCSKLEYLVQFNLKEKKNASTMLSASSSINTSNKEYWNFFVDVLKEGRGFQDAIKYVKNLNEIKTNLGRGRAFIRFCLQYHRLADAIQQLTMDDKQIIQWYFDKCVWMNESHKERVIKLLYDLNDINFELLAKNNYELDTTWPTVIQQQPSQQQLSLNKQTRSRTYSISSLVSFNVDAKDQSDSVSNTQLLSTTPLEMDDSFLSSSFLTNSLGTRSEQTSHKPDMSDSISLKLGESNHQASQLAESVYYDVCNTNANANLTSNILNQDTQNTSSSVADTDQLLNNPLNEQVDTLNKELALKNAQNNELNACLIKQMSFCNNLSDMLKKSEQNNNELRETVKANQSLIENLNNENNTLKLEIQSIKSQLSEKTNQEEILRKETLTLTESVKSLKKICSEQENTICDLKRDLDVLKIERDQEISCYTNEEQKSKVALQLKEEENFLLNDQIQKLSKCVDEERETNQYLYKELNELRTFHKNVAEKNADLMKQLEMDNNEMKKRLVKLIKEKAELWQKADNLEYENLLKTNAMWIDDANVSNCMNCNSGFSLLLRKHHCRICLKIYCYYCCNHYLEYNNSKLRVCKNCFEAKENVTRLKSESSTIQAIKEASTIKSNGSDSETFVNLKNEHEEEDEEDVNENVFVGAENKTDKKLEPKEGGDSGDYDDDEADEDDKADINFEVRAEQLRIKNDSKLIDDANFSIYDLEHKQDSNKTSSKSLKEAKGEEKLRINQLEKLTNQSQILDDKFRATLSFNEQPSDKGSLNEADDAEMEAGDEENDLVSRKRIRKRKIRLLKSIKKELDEDRDAFAIVSQDEINLATK